MSRALANSPLVNESTKSRIQQLAIDSGYQVNQIARNLKTGSTHSIGLIVPEVSNPFYPKLIQQIADEARAAGFSLQLLLSGANQETEDECVASLVERRADGILLITAERGLVARRRIATLARSGKPVAIMGWVEDSDAFDLVSGDDAAGGAALAQHLIDLGHRNIATIGKRPHRGDFDRMSGFLGVLSKAGLDVPIGRQKIAITEVEVGQAVAELFQAACPPTAVFAYQDSLAAIVYKHLNAIGLRIPDDVTVVGFDDLDLATYLSPKLTTVGSHIEPLATAFVRMLIDRISGRCDRDLAQRVIVTPRLVLRDSSAPPSAIGTI